MPRIIEAHQSNYKHPESVQKETTLDMRPSDERSRTEKLANFSKKVNIVTAPIWLGVAGVGVATANPVLIGAGAVGAGVDTGQGIISAGVEKKAKNKRIEKKQEGELQDRDIITSDQDPLRTRHARKPLNNENGNADVASLDRRRVRNFAQRTAA